jgi:hypothetical protein
VGTPTKISYKFFIAAVICALVLEPETAKMMRIAFVVSLVLAVGLAIESNFYREETCANSTGFCVLESECPSAVTAEHKSLCPSQKKQGAVCCLNFPEADLNCHQLHNACQDTCPPALNRGRRGCPQGQNCCVLV